ncbi:UDP-N-acetylglucosamine 4,6-dehydratase (inverting) [Candidatus Nomurabacteria bacterium]|nr:UDP-N-acetylglucosamine 4,6-dehydratase (inverting) [Candidatus Nomurabacteria bacterium]
MSIYRNKTILITGGTGSFGKNYINFLLTKHKPKKVIVFSRDELKQFQMEKEFQNDKRIRFFLGDVRDLSRLQRAFHGVDIVVHAAALKQVPAMEYNPMEAIKTNVEGSQNVLNAAIDQRVDYVLLISTDKASAPVNLYGATKMCAEKLFVASNVYSGDAHTKLSAVRYGNVIGSRGSIVETILNSNDNSPLGITHPDMTRFWITLDQCFELVTYALTNMQGGEIFIPKVPSMKVSDLFGALAPDRRVKVVGIRPGEKIHESLITTEESSRGLDLGDYFVICPVTVGTDLFKDKYKKGVCKVLKKDFAYTSDTNKKWLKEKDIQKIIKK